MSKLITLSADHRKGHHCHGPEHNQSCGEYVSVKPTAANGFYVTSHIYVEPKYIDPPTFTRKPAIGASGRWKDRRDLCAESGRARRRVDHRLVCVRRCAVRYAARGRCEPGQCAAAATHLAAGIRRQVRRSRHPAQTQHQRSGAGDCGDFRQADQRLQKSSHTTSIPTSATLWRRRTTDYVSGMWTVLGTWTSSVGDNLVNGYGLRIASIGAQLLYQDDKPTGDMRVKVVMTPEKTAGQGFGIAGSPDDNAGPRNQKADIFIKYDPRTRNGYSLRFWRTIQACRQVHVPALSNCRRRRASGERPAATDGSLQAEYDDHSFGRTATSSPRPARTPRTRRRYR